MYNYSIMRGDDEVDGGKDVYATDIINMLAFISVDPTLTLIVEGRDFGGGVEIEFED